MTDFPSPIVTVDVVVVTIRDGQLCVGLLEREQEPFAGHLALIGGYVRVEEDRSLEDAATRILRDKVGLIDIFIEQLMTFSGSDRDHRGWSLSVAYFALVPWHLLERMERRNLHFIPVEEVPDLPFDHNGILEVAISRIRGKGGYSVLPARFLPERFTIPELFEVYSIAMGETLNLSSFRRKIGNLGILERVEGEFRHEGRRPAEVYRLAPDAGVFDRRI